MKISWPVYLTPHPVLCLGNLKKSKSGSNKRSNIFICNMIIAYLFTFHRITAFFFIDLSNISLCMSRIVGVKIP